MSSGNYVTHVICVTSEYCVIDINTLMFKSLSVAAGNDGVTLATLMFVNFPPEDQ